MNAENYRAAVQLLPDDGVGNELARTMLLHPLVDQEVPHSPEYGIYNGRLVTTAMADEDPEDVYWQVRCNAVMRHTAELPIEISGVDAERLLNLVCTRNVANMRVGRCSYQIACFHDGGIIVDGVLVRLAEDRFWFVQADGDLSPWLRAHAKDMQVSITDPNVWVTQVQGPESMRILEAAVDHPIPEPFRYFDAVTVRIAGQPVVVTRTGFTNELGWEFYLEPGIDATAVGDRILEAGQPFTLKPTSVHAFRARRIEAGLMNAGSDFDDTTTPFVAGLGAMVDFEKGDFIGRDALAEADRACRTWGLQVDGGVATLGPSLSIGATPAGVVNSSAWSPGLNCGVAIVRTDTLDSPGAEVEVVCTDGLTRRGLICEMPMYDEGREIPRGLRVDKPSRPQ